MNEPHSPLPPSPPARAAWQFHAPNGPDEINHTYHVHAHRVDESHMTGESDDVVRLPSPHGPSLLLSGSKVLEGFGTMLVLAVGPNSQQGQLQALVTGQASGAGATAAAAAGAAAAGAMAAAGAGAAAAAGTAMAGADSSPHVPAHLAARAEATAAKEGAGEDGGEAEEGGGGSDLQEDTFLMRKLEVLAGQIGSVGVAAAGGVLAINCVTYTLDLLRSGLDPHELVSHLQRYLDFFITSITILVGAFDIHACTSKDYAYALLSSWAALHVVQHEHMG